MSPRRRLNLIVLDLACSFGRAEIPLLAHTFLGRASTVRRPPQNDLSGSMLVSVARASADGPWRIISTGAPNSSRGSNRPRCQRNNQPLAC